MRQWSHLKETKKKKIKSKFSLIIQRKKQQIWERNIRMCKNNTQTSKKFLIVATVASMIGQCNMDNIHILLEMGYEVHVGCNFNELSVWTKERIRRFRCELSELGIKQFQIGFTRTPYHLMKLLKSFRTLRKLIKSEQYDGIHCHTPVAGLIARIAALNTKTKVIYTAHGFHFYKKAPIKNWLIYYPIEKICSYMTDTLITINKEDYILAKKKMHAKQIEYIPGVGIDSDKFERKEDSQIRKKLKIPKDAKLTLSVGELNENKNNEAVIRASAELSKMKEGIISREELGCNTGDIVFLSVGELSKRKNHKVVIKALSRIDCCNIKYLIAGQGKEKMYLEKLIESLGLEEKVKLLGFRNDVDKLYQAADIFIFPSFQEGLPVALMEAMASGLPCIVSNIRGNVDLIKKGKGGILCSPTAVNEFVEAINELIYNKEKIKKWGTFNQKKIKKFDKSVVRNLITGVYTNTLQGNKAK